MVTDGEYPNTVYLLNNNYKLHWRANATAINIGIEASCTGWVGFGFGNTMTKADMIIGYVSNENVFVGMLFYWK